MSPSRRLLAYLFRYRRRYAAGFAGLAVAAALSLGIPWTVKRAVDAIERDGAAVALWPYVGTILLLAAGNGLARLSSRFAVVGAGQWVEHDIRTDLYAHLLTLPPSFYHGHRTGDLMSRASSDIAAVRALAGFASVMIVSTSLTFVGTVTLMCVIDPWLALYAMVPFPALVLIAKRFNHKVDQRATAVQAQLGVVSARVQENLTGMAVVRAYTMEGAEIAAFERANDEYFRRSVGLARVQAVSWPLLGAITGLGALIVLWLGGKAVVDGRITLGAFVAFNGYLAQLAWPTIALGWTLANVQKGLASMQRVAEILVTRPGADAPPPAPAKPAVPEAPAPRLLPPGDIEFRDLTFSYEDREPALAGVSFTVPEGAVVTVVGPTGSGKSTLGALLCRLFEPPRGSIFVGGVDVRDLPVGQLRRSIGYVPQEAFLFSRSLGENVRLADDDAPLLHVTSAAEAAGLAEDVEGFPRGWDTVVGERGMTLSGGQRQRVALARALVGSPPFLILDDVLASVDAAKEWEILRSLRGALAGRTTLMMTHRLRAAQESDWVVVLDEGRVAEQGRHAELLAAGGLYARLWRVQQLEDELTRA